MFIIKRHTGHNSLAMQVFSCRWHVSLVNEYFGAVFMHICLHVSNIYVCVQALMLT